MASRQHKNKDRPPRTVPMLLSSAEVRTLVVMAPYYTRSMGPFRHVVRLTTSRATRQRFSFVAEESMWLSRFALAVEEEMTASGADSWQVELTPRTLVAFWGRLLSSLRSKRSRRKLSTSEVELRESLVTRFVDEAVKLAKSRPEIVVAEIETRRAVEQAWMREQLQL